MRGREREYRINASGHYDVIEIVKLSITKFEACCRLGTLNEYYRILINIHLVMRTAYLPIDQYILIIKPACLFICVCMYSLAGKFYFVSNSMNARCLV